jgi:hypothetical protein
MDYKTQRIVPFPIRGLGRSGGERLIRRLAFLMTSIVVTMSVVAKAAAESKLFESRLPGNVPFVAAADNVAATCAAWQATQSGQLLSGELFIPIRQAAEKQDVATLLYLRPCFGFDWQNLSSYTGPAAVAVVPLGSGKTGLAFVFPASNEATDKLLSAGRAYFRDRNFKEATETAGKAKISAFRPPASSESPWRPTYLVSDSLVVAASHREAALAIWEQFNDKTTKSLASLKDFGDLATGQPSAANAPAVRWWVRPVELWAAMQSGPPPTPRSDWLGIARRQGIEAIRAVGGQVTFPTSGPTDLDLRGRVLVTQPLTKAAKLLDFSAASPLAIPEWFDTGIASVSLWGCDVSQAVTAFGHLFDELNEPGPTGQGVFQDMLAGLRDDPEGPQVDLLRDLFPHLGPSVIEASDCHEETVKSKTTKTRRTLLVLQCRDHDKVLKTLKRFYLKDEDIKEQTIEQGTLWTVGEGRSLLFEGFEGEKSSKPAAGIRAILLGDKTVVLATEPEMLTSRLAGRPSSSLAKNAAYESVSKWWSAGENRDIGFVQTALWLAPSYGDVLGKSPADDWPAAMLRLLFTGSFKPSAGFPVEDLPAFAKVAPRLSPIGSVREKDAGGWAVRASILRSPSAKP